MNPFKNLDSITRMLFKSTLILFSIIFPSIIFSKNLDISASRNMICIEERNEREYNNMACPRQDILCQSFTTGFAFASAVVAELNSIIMGCPPSTECSPTCCSDLQATFALDQAFGSPSINPWFYCSTKSNCTIIEPCVEGGGSLHNDVTISLQDQMVSYVRSLVYPGPYTCTGSSVKIRDIHFFIESIPNVTCNNSGCADLRIKVNVIYYFCCSSGSGQ